MVSLTTWKHSERNNSDPQEEVYRKRTHQCIEILVVFMNLTTCICEPIVQDTECNSNNILHCLIKISTV